MKAPERERARHQIASLRAVCDSIELALNDSSSPGHDGAQAVTQAATALAMTLARIDVWERVAEEQER